MKTLPIALALVVFAGAVPSFAAHTASQPRCGESSTIKSMLKKQWGEYPVTSGILSGAKYVMVMYANEATGTWTAVRFTLAGFACILGAGDGFNRFDKPKPKGKPA